MAALVSYEKDHVLVTFPEGLIKGYDSFPLNVITRCGLRFEVDQKGKRTSSLAFYGGMYSNRVVFKDSTPEDQTIPAIIDAHKGRIPYSSSRVKGPDIDFRDLYGDDPQPVLNEAQQIGLQWAGYVFSTWFSCKQISVLGQKSGLMYALFKYEFIITGEIFEASFVCNASSLNLIER